MNKKYLMLYEKHKNNVNGDNSISISRFSTITTGKLSTKQKY